jgi:hypothetical protein
MHTTSYNRLRFPDPEEILCGCLVMVVAIFLCGIGIGYLVWGR